jgi:hypothetical protein
LNELDEKSVECPYCGESIDVLIDESDAGQSYIEDCQVCCRPIIFHIGEDPDGCANVIVRAENE